MKIYKRILLSLLISLSVNILGTLAIAYFTLNIWWFMGLSDIVVLAKVVIFVASIVAVGIYLEKHDKEQQ